MFADRAEAALQLLPALEKYRHQKALILAIPRGAVPMGDIIARNLDLPLEPALVKKIGHPQNEEVGIGAASLRDFSVDYAVGGVTDDYIRGEVKRLQDLLTKRLQDYTGRTKPVSVQGKIVILLDDGLATGETMQMLIKTLRPENPIKIVVALPVASPEGAALIGKLADEFIAIQIPQNFLAVGQFYEIFEQVTDEGVGQIFAKRRVGEEG